ncbi:MAG: hypothetical protein ABSC64_15720 [Candidatus Korobacteraceae bacterium]|jgi:hypothetical protein
MLATGAFDEHVLARLLDFFSDRTAWQRTLWSSGTVLSLNELLEASDQVAAGVVGQAAMAHYAHCIEIAALRDFGVGDEKRRKLLGSLLRTDDRNKTLAANGLQYKSIAHLIPEIASEYLKRWSDTLTASPQSAKPERAARSIAAHLLDCGFHPQFLHKWWTYKAKYEPGTKTLAELLREADALASAPPRAYEALLVFEQAPPVDSSKPQPAQWLNNKQVSEWLRKNGFSVAGLRQKGGFLLSGAARDNDSVVETAAETASRLISRINLGSTHYNRLAVLPQVWIRGEMDSLPLPRRRRRVEVHSLQRENQLYDLRDFSVVDAAMELVEPLDEQPPSAAVAGGWAAIEALLTGPGDRDQRILAGDRMAALVACSFPRAELTTLSYELEKQGGPLGDELKACATNKDRCEVLVREIGRGTPLIFPRGSDQAALNRLTTLLNNPDRVLKEIEARITESFRRLYRNRNIVLHGGKTDAVGLRACLRIAAPLVGAGLDRIAHAAYTEGLSPLELAARARIRLDSLDSAAAVRPIELLS